MRFLLPFLGLVLIIAGCRDQAGYREDELFMDYQVTGEEGADQVSVLVQFRERNSYGPTVELRPGSGIKLDGKRLELNKGTRNGPIYIASLPVHEFTGGHQLVYTDLKGRDWKQEFIFSVFTLVGDSVLSRPIDSAGFILTLKGRPPLKKIRVLMTDTSYAGEEIDKTVAVNNNRVQIKKNDLKELRPGPVQLELVAEQHKTIERKGQTSGTLSVAYTLRREFHWEALPDSSRKP
jgi:hypothetical protein